MLVGESQHDAQKPERDYGTKVEMGESENASAKHRRKDNRGVVLAEGE